MAQSTPSTTSWLEAAQPGTRVGDWAVALSRSTGKKYWFNVRTNASMYTLPPELEGKLPHLRQGQSAATPSSSAAASKEPAPRPAEKEKALPAGTAPAVDLMSHAPFHQANIPILTAVSVFDFRMAVQAICEKLRDGGNTCEAAPGFHRFPPGDGDARFIERDIADEFELQARPSGEAETKHIVVWRADCPPPEQVEAEKEEKLLEAEAEKRRAAEAAAAAQAAKKLAAAGAGAGAGSKVKGKGAGAQPISHIETVKVEPLFAKKDKRPLSQMMEEIKRGKRPRTEDGQEETDHDAGADGAADAGDEGER